MKRRMRVRYYCDFCKKSGGRIDFMERHESGCVRNPDRECTLCDQLGICPLRINDFRELFPVPASGLQDGVAEWRRRQLQGKAVLAAILAKADELQDEGTCPICILAMIRQSGTEIDIQYDWKKKKESLWKEINQQQVIDQMG